mmetsp:Transcript_70894/g.110969  ORF Transcript_70894/g.110969 Transcript_70894/m.110969 type:complete len:133 (+) Transcript_70894:86-484(+)
MVRSVCYRPTKAFKLSGEEQSKYKEIAEKIKNGAGAATLSATSIEAALATVSEYEGKMWNAAVDDLIDENDAEFVGFTLDASMLSSGEIEADTSDVILEEPREVSEEEAEEENERDLWCDGEKNPEEDTDDA